MGAGRGEGPEPPAGVRVRGAGGSEAGAVLVGWEGQPRALTWPVVLAT